MRAGNNHEKEYVVTVDKPLNRQFVSKMANGIPILDTVTKKCKVIQTAPQEFKIVLTQGLNRQIRRMCEYLGYEVVTLKRTRIMNVTLKGLKVGQWRHLTDVEMAQINDSIADSGKTQEHSVDTNKQNANNKREPKKRDFQGENPRAFNNERGTRTQRSNTPFQKRSTTYVGKGGASKNTQGDSKSANNKKPANGKARSSGTLSLKK